MAISSSWRGLCLTSLAAIAIAVATSTAHAADPLRQFRSEVLAQAYAKTLPDLDGYLEGYAGEPTGPVSTEYPHLDPAIQGRLACSAEGGSTRNPAPRGPIAWNTAAAPNDVTGQLVTFVWEASQRYTSTGAPYTVTVDGKARFVIKPLGGDGWSVAGPDQSEIRYHRVFDQPADNTNSGYLTMTVPAAWLTPGKALRIGIACQEKKSDNWLLVYENPKAAASLRARRDTPMTSAVCQARGGVLTGEATTFRIFAHPDCAGQALQLKLSGTTVAEGVLTRGEAPGRSAAPSALSEATLTVSAQQYDATGGELLTIVIDGKEAGRAEFVPAMAKARELLKRSAAIVATIVDGKLPAGKERRIAMVVARQQLLEGLLRETDEGRYSDLVMRADSPEAACDALATALAEFEAKDDPYPAKRGQFETAYISTADGSGQIYTVYIPEHYDPSKQYRLRLNMHGGGDSFRLPGVYPSDYIWVYPDGRGSNGYSGLGELDLLEVLKDVRAHYSIDPERIVMYGFSMGAGGAWRMSTRYPDMFAAAEIGNGGPARLCYENLRNVPVWTFHDDSDNVVSIAFTRVYVDALQRLGYPVVKTEARGTGLGHSDAARDPAWKIDAWRDSHHREPYPRQVTYATPTTNRGKAYWVNLLQFTDPNRLASVDAFVAEGEPANQLFLQLHNVDVLAVELPAKLFDKQADLGITIDGPRFTIPAPLPDRIYIHRGEPAKTFAFTYQVSLTDPRPARPYRPYAAGGIGWLHTGGEPLLIVKGTGGSDAKYIAAVARFCEYLSARTGRAAPMPVGRIPVKADVDVTATDLQRCNLILVGSTASNTLLARLAAALPAREKGGALTFGDETYPLQGCMYEQLSYNPEAPQRLILVIGSTSLDSQGEFPGRWIVGETGGDAPFGLTIQSLDGNTTLRRVVWDNDWKTPADASEGSHLPGSLGTARGLALAKLDAMKRVAGADVAIGDGWDEARPEAVVWDVAHARWHDLHASLGDTDEVYVATVRGEQLRTVLKAMLPQADGSAREPRRARASAHMRPELTADRIVTEARYRIVFTRSAIGGPLREVVPSLTDITMLRVDLGEEIQRTASQEVH
jgi:pimeloyl-ACP methyl ester carboxylesterase